MMYFLCSGAAAVGQLQAVHGPLSMSDEEHAPGVPLHQSSRRHTLRAHAEVNSYHRRLVRGGWFIVMAGMESLECNQPHGNHHVFDVFHTIPLTPF